MVKETNENLNLLRLKPKIKRRNKEERNREVVVEHTLREGNVCTDVLAKMDTL
jgi:hypothetical protein